MKRIVLTFGLIAGAIISATLAVALAFKDAVGFDRGEIIGYTSMVIAFLFIFFGVRAYRDNVAGGRVSFGRAFAVGGLIAVVASLCYVATWEVIYFNFAPDYLVKFRDHAIEKTRASGASAEAIAQKTAQMDALVKAYQNPLINSAMTFLEPMPVAIIVTLVTAGVLSRRRKSEGTADAAVAGARTSTG
jgi:hypothetical protein